MNPLSALAIISLVVLASIAGALPPYFSSESSEPGQSVVDFGEFWATRGTSDKKYNILENGAHEEGDRLLKQGFMAFALEKEPNKHRVTLKKQHKVITYSRYNYTSGADKDSTLKITGGGKGFNYVDIEFTSETKYLFVYYQIYGFFNDKVARQ